MLAFIIRMEITSIARHNHDPALPSTHSRTCPPELWWQGRVRLMREFAAQNRAWLCSMGYGTEMTRGRVILRAIIISCYYLLWIVLTFNRAFVREVFGIDCFRYALSAQNWIEWIGERISRVSHSRTCPPSQHHLSHHLPKLWAELWWVQESNLLYHY